MAGEILYLDASALVKLVRAEPESIAMMNETVRWDHLVTSVVAAIELRRVALRDRGDPRRVTDVLARVNGFELDEGVRETAATLEPRTLRTLDAIHLATAIALEEDLGAIACYDERLARAAKSEGLRVVSPR